MRDSFYVIWGFKGFIAISGETWYIIINFLHFEMHGRWVRIRLRMCSYYKRIGREMCIRDRSGTWDEDFITELGIRNDIFPRIIQATDYVGPVLPDIAKECNLPPEVSV